MEEDKLLSIDSLLTQTCVVQKNTTSQAATGGVINTFSNRIASLPCLLNQRRRQQSEVIEFGKMTNRDDNILFTEYNTSAATIIASDRIVVGSQTFEVTKTPYDPGNRNNHFQIEVEEIT